MRTKKLAGTAVIVASLCLSRAAHAGPIGTDFTYQGQIKQNGVPVNPSANLQFTD